MSLRVFLILILLLLIDLYVFKGLKVLMAGRSPLTQKIISVGFWSITALSILTVVAGQFFDYHLWPKALRTYSFAIIVIIYLSKVFVVIFLLLDDLIRLIRLIVTWFAVKFSNNSVTTSETFRVSRLNFLVKTGFIVGAIPFVSMIYGMIGGAYNFRVRRVSLKFPNLPDAFEGITIAQLSDIHTGSYMSTRHLDEAMDLVMKQNADIIFFTGDLVNDLHTEALPFRDIFRKLKAPMGVYSILGNHDYGDYFKWNSIEDKEENLQKLKNFHGEIGWKLLLDEHVYLKRGEDQIGLIGVQNISAKGFSTYGSMSKATNNYEVQPVNILLSHDPSHWNKEVTADYKFIDLTLAGHTHGFQFGVEIPGFRWSPVQYFYKQWADLYKENDQYIYVNRGLGFIGYPGRVGILPEITVFTFNKG